MKQIAALILVLSSVLCYANEKINKEEVAKELSLKIGKILQTKDFASMDPFITEKLRERLEGNKLEKMMKSLETSYGTLDSILDFSVKKISEGVYYHRGLKLEKQNLDLVISLDEDNKVSNFRLAPYTDKTPWEAPNYVDSNKFTTSAITIGEEMPLMAEYTIPNANENEIIVVMVHGSGPSNMDERIGPNEPFKDLAYGFATKGIGSIRYNKRSYDYPLAMMKSPTETTIDNIVVDDAVHAIKKAKALGAKKIILIGHSLGGHMAPKIAETETVDGVITLAGNASVLEELLLPQFEHIMNNDSSSGITDYEINTIKFQLKNLKEGKYDSSTVGPVLPLGLPGSFWLSLKGYHPPKVSKKQNIPYLILNGDRDYQITVEDAKKWKNGNKHPKSKTIIYPKLNHMFFAGEGVCIPSEYDRTAHINSVVLGDMIQWIVNL